VSYGFARRRRCRDPRRRLASRAGWCLDWFDAVYEKLFSYDATKRHFVPRQSGYGGPVPESLDALSQDHEMIQFRKQHLGRYLVSLVTRPYDGPMINYLDMVGKIHTPRQARRNLMFHSCR
jgi:hypothetical protein